MKIVVAMSGGVDSAVAAALLQEAGHEVVGATLRLWDAPERSDRICSDWRDAGRVAQALGIPHVVIDERGRFGEEVVAAFVTEAAAGRTPNPCMACNARFKLGSLVDWAIGQGAGAVATGHYVRLVHEGGEPALLRAADRRRDQSYFLFEIDRRRLSAFRFPLGNLGKDEVRAYALRRGLPVAEKLDSQDLCFGDPATLVRAHGLGGRAGDLVTEDGRRLGGHEGVEGLTIGQRRGLGVATGKPLYVRSIDAATARVVVGPTRPVARTIRVSRWNWLARFELAMGPGAIAQVRSRGEARPARLEADPARPAPPIVHFDEGVDSAAPGQAVVLWRGEQVLGGGWIEAVEIADASAAEIREKL